MANDFDKPRTRMKINADGTRSQRRSPGSRVKRDLNGDPLTHRTPQHLIPPPPKIGRPRKHEVAHGEPPAKYARLREPRKTLCYQVPGFRPCHFYNWTDAADFYAIMLAKMHWANYIERPDGTFYEGAPLGYHRRVRARRQKIIDGVLHKQYEMVLAPNACWPGNGHKCDAPTDDEMVLRFWISRTPAIHDPGPVITHAPVTAAPATPLLPDIDLTDPDWDIPSDEEIAAAIAPDGRE